MRVLCLVAHPDDCAIFGYRSVFNHNECNWKYFVTPEAENLVKYTHE